MTDSIRDGVEDGRAAPTSWHLTPSDSRIIRSFLYLSWSASGGFLLAFLALVVAAVGVALGVEPTSVAGSATVGLALLVVAAGGFSLGVFGVLLRACRRSRHGRAFLRLRAPEPSDPTRSVVEQLSTPRLVAAAGAGATVHAIGLAIVVGQGITSFAYILPVGVCYLASVQLRWRIPTAGAFDPETERVVLVDEPRGTGTGGPPEPRKNGSQVETSRKRIREGRSWAVGSTALATIPRPEAVPVVAVLPCWILDEQRPSSG